MDHSLAIASPSRPVAIAEGIATTLIWASSFVGVKMALDDLGPLTIAGLRYFLGFLVLIPFMARQANNGNTIRSLPSGLWLRLFLIGFSAYAIGNGALFWGMKYLPATTSSFLSSLIPILILFAGMVWLKEVPLRLQVAGTVIGLAGSVLFFSPGLDAGEPLGMVITAIGLVGFVSFGILGREIARDGQVDALTQTAVPLAFGGGLLLCIALPMEGLPACSVTAWGIVLWLAVVNTALAYTLYNHSLQTLTALEINALLNLSPLGTAVLAWHLLDERLEFIQIAGMVVVIIGVTLVQWRKQAAGDQSRPR